MSPLTQQLIYSIKAGNSVKTAVDLLLQLGMSKADVDAAVASYKEMVSQVTALTDPSSMVAKETEHWYPGPSDADPCWPPLASYLRDEKHWPETVIGSVDQASTKIVGLLAPPGRPRFATRGLVLGYVQSGKTANFTAVIAKAADAGYKFFIVLSGLHNGLRQQTQKRLEQELVDLRPDFWHRLTSREEDFRPSGNPSAFLTDHANQRVLCVMKKNGSRLRALLGWLKKAQKGTLGDCPMLMIDDEADQASVDTKGTEDPSTINKLILDILGQFPKGAYLAYTATPFANILSDPLYPNLLYPRDFIVDLPMPEGYYGTERIFGSEPLEQGAPSSDGLPMIRTVPDEEVGQVKPPTRDSRDSFQPQLANSLVDAMLWFLLSWGVRRARGQAGQHMSMLIHTTLYTDVHVRFESLLRQDLKQIQEKLLKGDVVLLQRIGSLWAEETAKIPAESLEEKPVRLESALAELPAVLAALRVVIDNAKSESRLSFPEGGSTQIVVGGNTLSRGLTIEGLMVSYFVRASHMYDTLLQMAGWFGYRWGYADLPRIWMTTELAEHFQHLAQVEQEVRRDIRAYEEQQLTPKDFAPHIQTHSTLAVTSPLKMRYAVTAEVSYNRSVKQTTYFQHRDAAWLERNRVAAWDLLESAEKLRKPERVWGRTILYRDIPVRRVLSFLEGYQIHELHQDFRSDLVRKYVEAQNRDGQLLRWNIGVVSQEKGATGTWDGLLPGGQAVNLLSRARYAVGAVAPEAPEAPAYVKAILAKLDRAIDCPRSRRRPGLPAHGPGARRAARARGWRPTRYVGRIWSSRPRRAAASMARPDFSSAYQPSRMRYWSACSPQVEASWVATARSVRSGQSSSNVMRRVSGSSAARSSKRASRSSPTQKAGLGAVEGSK